MSDPYEHTQRGGLKLKGVAETSHKKSKKKKKKEKERDLKKRLELVASNDSAGSSDERTSKVDDMTPAQRKFKEIQDKRAAEQLLKKAEKTHKEKILEFNHRLDSLTEHFDIPKVSWTK